MLKPIRQHGLFYTIGIVINRIVPAKLFRFRVFRVYELHPLPDRATDDRFQFCWCESREELQLAKEVTHFDADDGSIAARYRARLAHELADLPPTATCVGGVWQARQWFDEGELGLRIELDPDQAWIFAAHVAKTHRGQGIYASLLHSVLLQEAHQTHYASINPTNKPSLAAHGKFIQATMGTCVALRVFGLAICWVSAGLHQDRRVTFNGAKSPIFIRIERR